MIDENTRILEIIIIIYRKCIIDYNLLILYYLYFNVEFCCINIYMNKNWKNLYFMKNDNQSCNLNIFW